MSRILKLASAALIALTLAGGAAYAPALAGGTSPPIAQLSCPGPWPTCDDDELAGDPSQWGVESAYKKGSFDITEFGGSEEPLAAGGTSKGGDVPVVTG
jgi:hypothetical protein